MKNSTLGSLGPGDSGVVVRVTCERPLAVRLMEMGLCPGTRVAVRRMAPLGDPMEVCVSGYALSIRRAAAMGIEVREVEKLATAPTQARDELDASLVSARTR